jgi:putative membrane protein
MVNFLLRWAITAVSLAVAAQLIAGIRFDGPSSGQEQLTEKLLPVLLVALILTAVTAFVKPVVKALSFPLILLTLGIFLLVINALMLMLTGWLAGQLDIGFHVDGFWAAVGGAIIISITTWLLDALVKQDKGD